MKQFTTITLIFLFKISLAQQTQSIQQFPNTVEGQFQKLYKQSSNYQIYKVIKKDHFTRLQKNVVDSIMAIKKTIVSKQKENSTLQEKITVLEKKITTLETNLSNAVKQENSIYFFGIELNKITYNIILWGIILALIASLSFFIFKFNNSNLLTKSAKNSLESLEQDFEEHRKKAMLKEQKLRRQLQDEINKQRGV